MPKTSKNSEKQAFLEVSPRSNRRLVETAGSEPKRAKSLRLPTFGYQKQASGAVCLASLDAWHILMPGGDRMLNLKGRKAVVKLVTRYLNATDHHPSRILAKCQGGRVIVSWDHELDDDGNHKAAAVALMYKLGWGGEGYRYRLVGGGMPDGKGNAYVLLPLEAVKGRTPCAECGGSGSHSGVGHTYKPQGGSNV